MSSNSGNIGTVPLAPIQQGQQPKKPGGSSALKDIGAGTIGGIAQTLVGHPLDTVKVRLQTQIIKPGVPPEFSGMVDCFRKTIKLEGFVGLYKGAASPLAGAMANNASLFFCYGLASRYFKAETGRPLTVLESFLAGAFAGIGGAFTECPIDLLKSKIQVQTAGKQSAYKGVFDAASSILKRHGIFGIYQGMIATCLRNGPAFGSYFAAFEAVKRPFTPPGEQAPLPVCFMAGGAAGFFYWGIIYPIDVVKTRLQTDSSVKAERKYRGILDCIVKTYRDDGLGAFWRGYIPCLIRGVGVNACLFVAVEATKRFLGAV